MSSPRVPIISQTLFQGFKGKVLFINPPKTHSKNFEIIKNGELWFGPSTYDDCKNKIPKIESMPDCHLFSVVERFITLTRRNKPPEIMGDDRTST